MKKLLVFVVAAMVAGAAFADWGFYAADRSWVTINTGSLNSYTLWDTTAGTFEGHDFGTFNIAGTFLLTAFDTKTYKNGDGDVTGTEYFYTVYQTGSRPITPAFTSLGGGWIQDYGGGNQQWGATGLSENILASTTAGHAYTLEIYGLITGTGTGPSSPQYDNNGGPNYTATFATAPVPEPATMSLLGLGALAMVLRRKIRK